MTEELRPIKRPSIHEAITAATTLENWLLRTKSPFPWLSFIRDIRHDLRLLRDNSSEENEPNEPL